jgi:hypothetical protein
LGSVLAAALELPLGLAGMIRARCLGI